MTQKTKPTTTLTRALALIGRDRNWFNHLQNNDVLATTYEESKGGRARSLTRENVLELAFLSALIAADLSVAAARHITINWLASEKKKTLKRWFAFSPGPVGHLPSESQRGYFDCNITLDELAETIKPSLTLSHVPDHDAVLPGSAEKVRLINLGEIVRRVDALLRTPVSA